MREIGDRIRCAAAMLLCLALCAALCGCGGGSSYAPPVFSSPEPEEAYTRSLPGEAPTPWGAVEAAEDEPLQKLRELPEPSPATAETPVTEPTSATAVQAPAPSETPSSDPVEASPAEPAAATPSPVAEAPDEALPVQSASTEAIPAKPDPNGDYRSVTITETGKKYHRKDCRFAGNGFPVDIYTAAAAGYEACKVCEPFYPDDEILAYLRWLRVEDRSLYVPADYRPDKIEQEELVSSFIAALGYDGDRGVLTVLFRSGHLHAYYQVPPEVYAAFREAEDPGAFYTAHIRGEYPYEQLK